LEEFKIKVNELTNQLSTKMLELEEL